MEPYYPVNDPRNSGLLQKYMDLATKEEDVIFAGRLAEYKYYDMAPTIERAMQLFGMEKE
jgi:UDP-galactopyranose mutase